MKRYIYKQETPSHHTAIKGIVFDMDGVLIDSRQSNVAFYNFMRNAVDLPPISTEEETYCHMASFDEAVNSIIPAHLKEIALKAVQSIDYQENILPMLSLQDGLIEALMLLQSYKLHIGIHTNRANTVHELLHYFGVESFFETIKTPLNCAPKPNPEGLLLTLAEWQLQPQDIIFVGDSRYDQMAAQGAGVFFWAFGNPELTASTHIASFWEFNNIITHYVDQDTVDERTLFIPPKETPCP